jgi:hypothetical protein
VFDNAYLVGTGHEKLCDENAVLALDLLEQMGGLDEDSSFSAAKFVSQVCLPVKVVELWQKTMVKRFGHVASQSAAFSRVIRMLLTRQGLQRVLATMPTPLHCKGGSDEGLPECHALVQAMEACKAGGHGPPACVPGEGEETPATLPPSQNSQPSGSEAPANDTDMGEDELQALPSSLQVASEVVTDGREKIFQDVQARYSKILYTPTKDEFVKTSREELANNQRALILIEPENQC